MFYNSRAVRLCRKYVRGFVRGLESFLVRLYFRTKGVDFKSVTSNGFPFIGIEPGGLIKFGKGLKLNNTPKSNPIGRAQRCSFYSATSAKIIVGDNVQVSFAAFYAAESIVLGNNVMIGGGTVIYDTDFHSVAVEQRNNEKLDRKNAKSEPIVIGNDVWIGGHCIILKGVSIGCGAVIGAGSVVVRNVPAFEVHAGNPARRVGKIDESRI